MNVKVGKKLALASLFICSAALIAARLLLDQAGLNAHYFTTEDFTGPAARSAVDPTVSTRQLSRAWAFVPPDVFSARWSGFLVIDRPGDYVFALTSDDGSNLYLDGRLIVANGGRHGLVTVQGGALLARGSHAVVLEYSQSGGDYQLEWLWARDGEPLRPVPDWRLSPRPRGLATLSALRLLRWMAPAFGVVSFLLLFRLAYLHGYWPPRHDLPDISRLQRPVRGRAVACLVLFGVLTIVQTWPLATNPAHLSRNDNADTMLNEWTLAWVAHQLPRHPLRLFEANIFYPEHRTLAYSENLFTQALMAAPMLWLGWSPVLVYNLVVLAGFALTGWAMCLVVASWTGDWAAGVASGIILAFNANSLAGLTHVQALHVEFLPAALFSLDALFRRPNIRWTAWLALAFALQALASIYLMVFTAVSLAVACIVRPEEWLGTRFKAVAQHLVLAAGMAGVLLWPFLLPYWRLRAQGFARPLDEAGFYAAQAVSYITTVSRFYPYAGGSPALFPGTIALLLAVLAVVSGTAWKDGRARMCLAFGAVGVLFSFGPAVAPGYEFLYKTVPVLQGIRVAARFGFLGIVAVAVLAGYGVAWLRGRLTGSAWRQAAASIIVVLVFLDPLAAPISYTPFDGIPDIYRLPAADESAVTVELPMAAPAKQFRDAPYMLNSTLHWKPMLNGYSGFVSAAHARQQDAIKDFPDRMAIHALQQEGVTHVFVHLDQFAPDVRSAIEREPMLRQLAVEGSIALYRLDRSTGIRTP